MNGKTQPPEPTMYSAPTDDLRIDSIRPLLPPAIVMEEVAPSPQAIQLVTQTRTAVADIIHGRGKRLLVVVGPCSVHDPAAALEYAGKLKEFASTLDQQLLVIMRTYFEKPRTTVGWKGLINDPNLDGSFQINDGLRIARGFLRDVTELGMPTGTEFLDPISPQFVADLVCWGAIGARTTESQVHRELASGLSMPVGFKNGTRGTVQIAYDAIGSSSQPHRFLGVTKQGITAIVSTKGNPNCHVILRGGIKPNYDATTVQKTLDELDNNKLVPRVMVDCSHANSGKDHTRQPAVAEDLAQQIRSGFGPANPRGIFGIMLESFLEEGRQDHSQDHSQQQQLTYGKSITDACMGWDTTRQVLENLANAVSTSKG